MRDIKPTQTLYHFDVHYTIYGKSNYSQVVEDTFVIVISESSH